MKCGTELSIHYFLYITKVCSRVMSFLGSTGTVMGGSGFVEALECCYGPNSVAKMIAGKAVSRA